MTDLTLTPDQRAEALAVLRDMCMGAIDCAIPEPWDVADRYAARALDALLPLLSGWRPEPVAPLSDGFIYQLRRAEWRVVKYEVDQYGQIMSDTETTLSTWPTVELARADLPNHGSEHKHVSGRWIPHDKRHDYEEIRVAYREVVVPLSALEPVALPDARAAAEALDAIGRARDTAMRFTLEARIPECGKFGEIAQDLDASIDIIRALPLPAAPPPDAIAAAEARGRAMGIEEAWQPRDTAPKDGFEFIAGSPGHAPFSAQWQDGRFIHIDPEDGVIVLPFDMWRPFPQPPALSSTPAQEARDAG